MAVGTAVRDAAEMGGGGGGFDTGLTANGLWWLLGVVANWVKSSPYSSNRSLDFRRAGFTLALAKVTPAVRDSGRCPLLLPAVKEGGMGNCCCCCEPLPLLLTEARLGGAAGSLESPTGSDVATSGSKITSCSSVVLNWP